MKICNKCNIEKSFNEFYVNKNSPDKRRKLCIECNKFSKMCVECDEIKDKEKFNINKKHLGGRNHKCTNCQKKYHTKYYSTKEAKEKKKQYRKDNVEKIKAYDTSKSAKKYRTKHKVKIAEAKKIYRTANREKLNKISLKYWEQNPIVRRENHYRIRYNITIADYDTMFVKQKGKCKICKSKDTHRKDTKNFCVDHCHKTGKVRGLLCHRCNSGIGKFLEKKKLLLAAIKYLEDSKN